MRVFAAAVVLVLTCTSAAAAQDVLTQARRLYNLGDYEGAERVARQATDGPGDVDGARVVLGRVQLERYRRSGTQSDLAEARNELRAVDPHSLDGQGRLELTIGLAEALFLEDRFGASAELFEPVIESSASLGPVAHERVLDWWATALDRQAQLRPMSERAAQYGRILDRMTAELEEDPSSAPASYWMAAATRGRGEVDRAWQIALAGWMRAPQTRDRGAALRADLDRLVVQAIIPERVSRLGLRDSTQALAGMLAEWESFKTTWSK